jgi:hypothetical protein
VIDPRVRSEHIAKYGATDDVEAYLRVIENIPSVSDDNPGEDHHMLARSIWPEYANLKANPWNRLRVHRGVHTALTELQGRFEGVLRFAAAMMKGRPSLEMQLEHLARIRTPEHQRAAAAVAGKKSSESGRIQELGRIQGRKNVESGHLSRICREGGRIGGKIAGKISGRIAKESGRLLKISSLGGKVAGRMAVESGHMARMQRLGGKVIGKRNAETPGYMSKLATIGNHNRYHLKRPGGFNPNCKLCFEVI